MRRVLLAGLLAAAGPAFAGAEEESVGRDSTRMGREAEKGWDKSKAALGIGRTEEDRKAAMLENGPTFTLSGEIDVAKGGHISLQRSALPPARLDVEAFTEVTLDGKPVEARYLPRGAHVQARFQLDGGKPVALAIHATSQEAIGGSGEPDNAEESSAHERGETMKQEYEEHPAGKQ